MPSLADVEREALTCTRCRLADGRTQVVFGVGNPHAELMVVGEAPGAQEDAEGLPFVGRSGQYLDRVILEEMGLTRADFYIANVVKCLRYTAMVQLGDGSWERIGRLVRSRYDGEVMSVTDDGRIVPRRVIGWHASPLAGRRVYRLTFRSAKRAGLARVSVHLTGDRPVFGHRLRIPPGPGAGARHTSGDGSGPQSARHGCRRRDDSRGRAPGCTQLASVVQPFRPAGGLCSLQGGSALRAPSSDGFLRGGKSCLGDETRHAIVMVRTVAHDDNSGF